MTTRFSIFIPCWNDTRWLPGAIESVLAQTYQDWELIVGDNASTEDVETVVRGYGDERIRYQRWTTHVDFAGNANRTSTLVRFEWAQFLSADDRLEPGCLAAMAAAVDAAEADGQSLAMVLTGCARYDETGLFVEDQPFFRTWRLKTLASGTYDAQAWLHHCAAPGGTPWNIGSMAIARSTLEVLGGFFREEIGMATDLELAARVAAYGQVAYVAEPLLRYTVRGDSITPGIAIRSLERGEALHPFSAAILSALAVHEFRRHVGPDERTYLYAQVADKLIARALAHRYHPGGRGRRAAAADLRRASHYSKRWMWSPRQLTRASAALVAPRSLLLRMDRSFRRRGIYV